MPKAHIVFGYHSIAHPQKFAAYAKLAPAAVVAFGSHGLARGAAAAASRTCDTKVTSRSCQ
jgi:hypothetical protein